jgi:hypothetical protein
MNSTRLIPGCLSAALLTMGVAITAHATVPESVTASDHDGNAPERMLDGDLSTRWSANGDGAYAIFDMGNSQTFSGVRAAFHKGNERKTSFSLEASVDGSTWTPVLDKVTSAGISLTHQRFDFKPLKARYFKYVGHGNTSNTWNSVLEFEPVNCAKDACSDAEVVTADMIEAAKVAETMEKNEGPATTLDQWKITLPTTYENFYGSGSETSAAEIQPLGCSVDQSSLSNETSNEYFKVTDKGWNFRVPLEGGATTPNATYIRTELRELYNWEPCNDTSKANWSYGGTHTMAATLMLNEIPAAPKKKDGVSADRPKVVLGQIHAHDINAATVKLLWEGADKPIRVILNKSIEKSAFSVSLGKIADPYKPWTYIITMTDDGIELAAGGVKKVLTFGKEMDNVWKDQTFYFKAGLYPQIHPESGGAFDVTYSKVSIDHKKRDGDFGTHVALSCDPMVFDCTCLETNPQCTWWPVPLPQTYAPAKPQPNLPPGRNFDLSGWYLSMPMDHDVNGKPDDVFPPYLVQGFEQPELFYTGDDGGLVIKSFIKGVRTSKNTSYVRTELREMLRRGDQSIALQGVNKNNWVFSSAPEADLEAAGGVDGILKATLKVDHVTTTGEPGQVGRVIIGQIHANDDEPIRLYYRKLPNHSKGSVYFAHENRNEGSDIYYNLVGDRSGAASDPVDGIALGEKFSYEIEVIGNFMFVTLQREGKDDVVEMVDMSESGYDVGGQYMYFKAGVYNQNNSGDPEDFVQATFYKLEKSHD